MTLMLVSGLKDRSNGAMIDSSIGFLKSYKKVLNWYRK